MAARWAQISVPTIQTHRGQFYSCHTHTPLLCHRGKSSHCLVTKLLIDLTYRVMWPGCRKTKEHTFSNAVVVTRVCAVAMQSQLKPHTVMHSGFNKTKFSTKTSYQHIKTSKHSILTQKRAVNKNEDAVRAVVWSLEGTLFCETD